jgi:amino acid transporter
MPAADGPSPGAGLLRRSLRAAPVLIISSVTFTFISYWRTAAVVLCDLASTAYYIGGIVEQAIGPAAPWFILAVMMFSYAVRWVYIESCTLFLRGGVYRVVREALGRFPAKVAVSALMFDYVLTGPISAVSAGQYLVGLGLEVLSHYGLLELTPAANALLKQWGPVFIAAGITIYFFRKNIIGIHESSDKALTIMKWTTLMAVIMIVWCAVTLIKQGPPPGNDIFRQPDLRPKLNYSATSPDDAPVVDPLGFVSRTHVADEIRSLNGPNWLSLIGVMGLFIAFGHSILAMSGEETLAQVYREVEAPKLPNFKKAAFIVFVYSLLFTGGISFLAVAIIPDAERMPKYHDNLMGGLAMNVIGPFELRVALNAFVCVIGFLILAGAVNTAMIGSNGVLNRVAEDGVMPDWFLKPHPKYGTTFRILWLVFLLQMTTIIASRGNVIWLGEAYAFGVVWSFVFQALSMVVLRFKDRRPREFTVPLNIRIGNVEFPFGLTLILLILLVSALMNLLTKEEATIGGGIFTAVFFTVFWISEHVRERRRRGAQHQHLEQFNRQTSQEITPEALGLTKPYRKLVSIRSPQNLFMLEKALAETDPRTTDVIVMTAKLLPTGSETVGNGELDVYDQELMTAVVNKAEQAGKQVRPLIVPTNNPLHAIMKTAADLNVNEVVMGASNKYTADEQFEQIAFFWISLHHGEPKALTVRILSRDRDMYLDLGGGNRIPKISERQARSVMELRAAGVGVDRVLLLHDGSPECSDLFQAVLTMLDPAVLLTLVPNRSAGPALSDGLLTLDRERAQQLKRHVDVLDLPSPPVGPDLVLIAQERGYDVIICPLRGEGARIDDLANYVLNHAHCRVFLAAAPAIPQEVVDKTPAP